MKRFIVFIIIVVLIGVYTSEDLKAKDKKFSIEFGAGVRGISAEHFNSIFSGTNLCYSVDIAYKIFKSGEIFIHSDYLAIEGETDYTKEKTTFSIIPAELGYRLLLGSKSFIPFIGIGGGYYSYTDEHPGLLTVSESKLGFFGEGGIKFYFSKSIFLGLRLKYIMLNSENETNLGGLAYTGSIGFSF